MITEIKVPGAISTQVTGINDFGVMTGIYEDRVGNHGFIGTVGAFTKFDVPGSAPGRTAPQSINNKGQVVGFYQIAIPGSPYSLEYDAGVVTSYDVPGSPGTVLTAINDADTVGGTYSSNVRDQGFTATTTGAVTKVFAPSKTAVALLEGVSNNGQAVGG